MERNAARLDRDPGIGGADAAGEEDRAHGETSGSETGQRQEINDPMEGTGVFARPSIYTHISFLKLVSVAV
jgi:hypothetical protein